MNISTLPIKQKGCSARELQGQDASEPSFSQHSLGLCAVCSSTSERLIGDHMTRWRDTSVPKSPWCQISIHGRATERAHYLERISGTRPLPAVSQQIIPLQCTLFGIALNVLSNSTVVKHNNNIICLL